MKASHSPQQFGSRYGFGSEKRQSPTSCTEPKPTLAQPIANRFVND
jgi:hypothetical protein